MIDEMIYKELKLSDPQHAVYNARTPLILDMAGQGSGKSENIGVQTIEVIEVAPKIKGFIGANTYNQLTTATLDRVFTSWRKHKGWEEYSKDNPDGVYVIDKKPPPHFKKFHTLKKYANTISFANGCLIFLGSMDNWKALDGKEIGWAHLDETKDTEEKAVRGVIMPRIRQVGLWYDPVTNDLHYEEDKEAAKALGWRSFGPMYIHTSPSYDGVEWLIKMFKMESDEVKHQMLNCLLNLEDFYYYQDNDITTVVYQSFWNAVNLRDGKLEELLASFTAEEKMLFLYGYPFTRTGGEYYKEYKTGKHTVKSIPLDPNSVLYLTFDFNVRPYVTCIGVQIDRVLRFVNDNTGEKIDFIEGAHHASFRPIEVMRFKFIQEFCLKPPNNRTEAAAEAATRWYTSNGGKGGISVYGDGSGHNEITGLAPLTQYKVIKRVIQKLMAVTISAKTSNIGVMARQKLLDKIFAGVFPEIEIYISKDGCPQTIRDFEFLKESPEGGKHKEKEKDPVTGKQFEKIGHTSDASEYLICEILKAYLKYLV